jgi:hypothetical protein
VSRDIGSLTRLNIYHAGRRVCLPTQYPHDIIDRPNGAKVPRTTWVTTSIIARDPAPVVSTAVAELQPSVPLLHGAIGRGNNRPVSIIERFGRSFDATKRQLAVRGLRAWLSRRPNMPPGDSCMCDVVSSVERRA